MRNMRTERVIVPRMPDGLVLHSYQQLAIEEWAKRGYRGIFDMATGTGKTFTGLAAVVKLSEHCNDELAVLIVCPYQHLVEQWLEDIVKFNMRPVVGYSASCQKDWKRRLRDAVIAYNLGVRKHFCLITTNATFSSNDVKEQIHSLKGNVLLLIDEAHNFGAENLSKALNPKIPYRLALSATLERHGDEEGTKKLFAYFGEKCIEYSLERAIQENKLTPYFYHPVDVYFNEDELEAYKAITKELVKHCSRDHAGKYVVDEYGKLLLIKRARIVAAATGKISILANLMKEYKHDKHILVYCGAATMHDVDYHDGLANVEEMRQVDVVVALLGNRLGMRISKFTSEETVEERERLKAEFTAGQHLQALVAIRCLDEGVNIPSIKTAFILASSTNPKEYVQRRGRVLRKYEGKNYAVIFDFITLPRPLDEVRSLTWEDLKCDLSLVKKEITRMKDFAAIAENPSDSDKLMNAIEETYSLYKIGGENDVL
ncbi:MAG: DEAD/DEAH box helicase family protein [Thermoclostridium sp.]|nr:DEAD/DEAH box helicase family protein [Thermoclostridium sp.]